MTNAAYIDGFTFPIAKAGLANYQKLAAAIAEIWLEYGALEYREFVGDDMQLEGTRSFTDVINADQNEVTVFGWVAFESREVRDRINRQVAGDKRVAELMTNTHSNFDAARMTYGGFRSLVGD